MLGFRSEAHAELWCKTRDLPLGAILTPQQAWDVAAFMTSKPRPALRQAPATK